MPYSAQWKGAGRAAKGIPVRSMPMTKWVHERFRLDLVDERLWDGARPVHLTRKTFQLLQLFLKNPDSLVTKDAIRNALWGEVYVSDGLVKEYVHDLRRALDDDPHKPTFIETVRGRGYRYLGGITCTARPAVARNGPPRVAVLPWIHHDGVESLALLGRGFSAELSNVLTKNRDLAVIARSSAAKLADSGDQIAKARCELRADYAIEGDVLPDGDGLRFALSAVNVETETIIWSDTFRVGESALGDFESEVAPRVAQAIGARSGAILRDATLQAKRRLPTHLTAFEQYLLALDSYTVHSKESVEKAQDYAGLALRKDPTHAQSWLLLSYILEEMRDFNPGAEDARYNAEREAAIHRAAELDPQDGRILIEHADCLYDAGDEAGSAQEYALAYDLNRGAADVLTVVAKYLAGVNTRYADARAALTHARDLNPLGDVVLALNELRTFLILGDIDAALEAGEVCPDTPVRSLFLALCQLEKGRGDIAREIVIEEVRRRPGFDPLSLIKNHHYIRAPAIRGRLHMHVRDLSSCLSREKRM